MRLPSDEDITGRDFGNEEIELLNEVIRSGTLKSDKGRQVYQLEVEFAEMYGVLYCRATQSAASAIHGALSALQLAPGDEIITSAIADSRFVQAIRDEGAVPVFCEVDSITWNATSETIAAKVTSRTKAIVVTHMFGLPVDVLAVRKLARGIPVIEDCSQAYHATVNGRKVGTTGDIGVFSLQQGSHISCGDGGLLITRDPQYFRRVSVSSERMTELQAAVARAQVRKLDSCVDRRRKCAGMMTERLIDVEGLTLPMPAPGSTHSYWKYPLLVDSSLIPGGAHALRAELKSAGISVEENSEPLLVLPWNEFYKEKHLDYLAMQLHVAVSKLQCAAMAG